GTKPGHPVFSPDGQSIAASCGDGAVRLYDAGTGNVTLTFRGPGVLWGPVFSPDGTRLLLRPDALDGDGMWRIYDLRTGKETLALKLGNLTTAFDPCFSPDGGRIAALLEGAVVGVYDVQTGQEAFTIKGKTNLGSPVFTPDGERIIVSPHDMNF